MFACAGSKPETNFPQIGPTTNHYFLSPSLKARLGKDSIDGVNYIAEIVYDAVSVDALKQATKVGIEAVLDVEGGAGFSWKLWWKNWGSTNAKLYDTL